MHTMASIPRCWASEAASWSNPNSQLSSLNLRHRSRAQQVQCIPVQRRSQVRCSIQEEFSPTEVKVNFKTKEFNLPNQQPKRTDAEAAKETLRYTKQTLNDAKEKEIGRVTPKLALWGGAATLGVLLSGTILSSLEAYPLLPETMQLVGLACSVLVASRVIRGKPEKFKVSPVKAVIAIVEIGQQKGKSIQQTSLVLPQGLDSDTVATMERLARERDVAVNQIEEMKQVLREKEALETVALQLAEERVTAMSEVNGLKSTVEAMSERMKGIEAMLDREVGVLKSQNQALETVALQLAQERDFAIQETVNLKARSEAEKQALEEVALQLARERDGALSELADLMNVVAKMRTPTSG